MTDRVNQQIKLHARYQGIKDSFTKDDLRNVLTRESVKKALRNIQTELIKLKT